MKHLLFTTFFLICSFVLLTGQVRKELNIPDIPGYKALKCDFHTHTVFSDGQVWPTIRVLEAYEEGLDAVAITDHVESRTNHKNGDLQGDHNRSYDIAKKREKSLDVLVIKGAEISRSMPPGHWNALFLENTNLLDVPKYEDAFKETAKQKAFTFWNHPGWYRHAPDTTKWLDVHTKLYNEGYMHGIEIANGAVEGYYPEAHQWALDKNLTFMGNTDIHGTTAMTYDFAKGEHRTMTIVFAKERTLEGIREALDNRRTVVWYSNLVIGRENLLKELLNQTIQVVNVKRSKKEASVTIKNNSDFTLYIKKYKHDPNLNYFREIKLRPGERKDLSIRFVEPASGKLKLDFRVENFYVSPYKGLDYFIEF